MAVTFMGGVLGAAAPAEALVYPSAALAMFDRPFQDFVIRDGAEFALPLEGARERNFFWPPSNLDQGEAWRLDAAVRQTAGRVSLHVRSDVRRANARFGEAWANPDASFRDRLEIQLPAGIDEGLAVFTFGVDAPVTVQPSGVEGVFAASNFDLAFRTFIPNFLWYGTGNLKLETSTSGDDGQENLLYDFRSYQRGPGWTNVILSQFFQRTGVANAFALEGYAWTVVAPFKSGQPFGWSISASCWASVSRVWHESEPRSARSLCDAASSVRLTDFRITGLDGSALGVERFTAASGLRYGLRGPRTPAPIPEPATWAMLIAGFGVVGVTARRRRGSTAIA
ncbi:MAG: PEPxxWA-CTERM sorting domain-containing protein [Sphingomonadaceae bacterium]|nr:PEPxxWA-CTERM sorting domain-containing protein [Sphingomonadaceae bacterium]